MLGLFARTSLSVCIIIIIIITTTMRRSIDIFNTDCIRLTDVSQFS
jgi:hypothetical protein